MKNGSIGATGIVLLASLFASFTAAAAERGFYIGGFYGQTKTSLDAEPFGQIAFNVYDSFFFTPETSSFTLDEKDSGYGFLGGYRWLRNLAFEAGYVDLGKYRYRDQSTGFFSDPDSEDTFDAALGQTLNVEESGIMLSALGILPLSYRTELYARGGVLFSSSEISGSVYDEVDRVNLGSDSDSDVDWIVGVGASFTVAEIYALRLEYQRIFDLGNKDLWGESDVDVVSLGFTVTF
ncbi:MAG TPA: outer membrane beta-barrel protein [Povalibacter sp.]|uniref:outer membrane beta-barrel protein n=1 Tax=Povalibacter sp. TaxID=1962978 RepID=UPI002B9F194A|nr:outer membrane beta-barrel protein [Povalibacter sp.]HMN43739.1 outer membrane beta-barrel protein [Povalibacter sp.]